MWFSSWLKNRNHPTPIKRYRSRRPSRPRARVLRLETLENRSMFSFGSPISLGFNGASPIAVTTADVNGDGKADIVAAVGGPNAVMGIEVTLGKGGGHFAKPAYYYVPNTQQVTAVALADINGDGKVDIITGNYPPPDGGSFGQTASISILLGNGNGTFAAAQTYANRLPEGSGPSSLVVADFNGDGKPDIATSIHGEVDVLFNGVSWNQRASYTLPSTAGGFPSTVVAGDLNGDGKLDLVAADGSGSACVLLNTGNGSFAAPQPFAAGGNAVAAAIGDFNGDGKLDIATANYDNQSVSVLLGNGNGTFGAAQSFAVAGPANAVVIGDFNKDGKLDIVASGEEMDILLGNGNGTFGAAQKVGPTGSALLVADFNGDGFPDLAQTDTSGGSIDVLINNADWNPKGHK
jgi:hypothetical protein